MDASGYAVTFGYGEWDGTFYTPAKPHRGNDRPCFTGVPVVIAGVTIALTGATGKVAGAHLHTQTGTDANCQNTLSPNGYEFVPGVVQAVGTADQWGNFVIIKNDKGNYTCYAHLSKIMVAIGQIIRGNSNMENKITDVHRNLIRVISSEVKGWDKDKVHSGFYDEQELKFWKGQNISDFSQQAWNEGDWYRKDKDMWKAAWQREAGHLAKIKQLEARVKELESSKDADPKASAVANAIRDLVK